MLGLRPIGPLRLSGSCSRRCGARLLAPIAPSWSRPGVLLLPKLTKRDVRLYAKRGRPRKDQSAQPPPEPAQEAGGEDAEGAEADKPRRGRRSRKEKEKEEARDLLESQQIDMEVLEEFKARAAAEEEARRAAMGDSGEDDPRRLNFHRSLLAASQRGLSAECARIVESMEDAGLPPGPRAIHVWAYSYIQIGDGPGARRIAEAGRETYGISWIPETYVALMHGALSCSPGGQPDLMSALELWVAQQDAGANPQLGFTFLAKELFRLRYSALAMQVVSEGYAAGLQPDEKLAALVIEQLCKQGLMEEARSEMQRLLEAGLLVGPDHYDTIVRLEAAGGNVAAARQMLQTYYDDPRFSPPRASSYTALLKGLVSALRPAALEADDPAAGSPAGGGGLALSPDQLDQLLTALREEMVAKGLRPGREAFAAMVEAFAVAGDLDAALATYETMTRAKGTPALLRKKYLGRFVVSLLAADRPLDALRLLRDCSTTPSYADARSCVTLPAAASAPLPAATAAASVGDGDGEGRSALTVWLPAHFEVMRERRGQRASVLTFMRDADMSSRREVDGVVLGLGGCVVTEDGLFVPPPKMTMGELRVELAAAGAEQETVAKMGRKELQKMVKERRERLPSGILEMQAQLEGLVAQREEERAAAEAEAAELEEELGDEGEEEEFDDEEPEDDTLDVNIASIIADEGTFEGGDSLETSATFRAAAGGRVMLTDEAVEEQGEADDEEPEDDLEEEDDDDMEEDFAEDMPVSRRRRRRGAAAAAAGDDDDDEALDDDDEEDDDARLLMGLGGEDGGEPALGDGLGPSGGGVDDLDWEVERGRVEGEDDALIIDQLLNMSVMDSSRYNGTAGMAVAMRLLELWVSVGCSPTTSDLLTLYEGAVLEEHPRSCADLAEQLPALMAAGEVGREQLEEMLLALANVCLQPGSPDGEAADRVVTVMEDNEMQVPADVYSALDAALNGRPRMRDSVLGVAGGRVEADLTGSGLESSVSVGDEDDEEEAGAGVLAGVLGSGSEDENADGEEAEEEGGEGGEGGEGEEDLDLYDEYEEDPVQLEEERLELQRLFQQDGEEDDAWLDELDEPAADVAEVRAAAEAEAAAGRQAELVEATLAAVRARSPFAAAVLERRLAAMQLAGAHLAEAEAADAAAAAAAAEGSAAALPAGGRDVAPYGAVAGVGGGGGDDDEDDEELAADAAEAAAMLDAMRAARGGGGDGGDEEEEDRMRELSALAAEAEWDTAAVLELPPVVLAEAAAAAEAEADETGVPLSAEDRAVIRRITAKAKLLAELSALNEMAAEAHPGGAAAAEAEMAEALRRIRRAESEAAAATTLVAAAAAADGETPESLAAAAADEDGIEAAGWEIEDEVDEEELEGEELLSPDVLEPGVDDGALEGSAAELLRTIMGEAEALLAAEEAEEEQAGVGAGAGAGDGEDDDEFDGLQAGAEEARQEAEVLQRMLADAEVQEAELTEEQQQLYDMLEAGDLSSLESALGPQAMTWLAEDLKRMAAAEGLDIQEAAAEAAAAQEGGEEEGAAGEEEGEAAAPELVPGWRLNERFLGAFAAVLRERAALAAAEGIPDDGGPEVAAMDALLALASGYRPEGFRGVDFGEEGEGEEEEGGEESVLSAVQREAKEALEALAREMGGPGEAAAREAAERALAEAMAVQSELYEEAQAEGEEAPRVRVRPGAAEGGEEEEWEEEDGEEGDGVEMPEAVPPGLAAAALRRLRASRPGVGPVFVAEPEAAGAGTAVAEVEPEAREEEVEEEEPRARGRASRGRGAGGATGGGRGARRSGR